MTENILATDRRIREERAHRSEGWMVEGNMKKVGVICVQPRQGGGSSARGRQTHGEEDQACQACTAQQARGEAEVVHHGRRPWIRVAASTAFRTSACSPDEVEVARRGEDRRATQGWIHCRWIHPSSCTSPPHLVVPVHGDTRSNRLSQNPTGYGCS